VVLVVPFAPGGPNDLVARLVAPAMQAALGQNVVVENRPGATGAIAARHVAAQPSDGHTLIVAASGTMTINPAVMTRPGYDPEKDFAPVSLAMSVPNMLVVNKDVPATTVAEVVAWLKREAGRASYCSGGVGSTEQLGMELFLKRTGTEATHIPFPGGAPAVTAMIQGQVQIGEILLSAYGNDDPFFEVDSIPSIPGKIKYKPTQKAPTKCISISGFDLNK
jgi:tripartite-type tricarboxylate transporter receptor subunit TctC